MAFSFPEVSVGEPARCSGLAVFPLFGKNGEQARYVLGDEAIATGQVLVEEVSEGGSVPELVVDNRSDSLVLFLEGEELAGAKQNRVLNTSILVAKRHRTKVPVSCVEMGRWGYRERNLRPTGHTSPHLLRHVLRSTVSESLRRGRSHRSDQSEVWKEVSRQQESLGTHSETSAMSDTFEAHEQHLSECRANLRYVDGASGFAVAVGARVASLDVFDRPDTCRKVWDRILSGAIMAALEVEESAESPGKGEVESLIAAAAGIPWERFDAAGEGEEYRADGGNTAQGAALVLDGRPVHTSVLSRP